MTYLIKYGKRLLWTTISLIISILIISTLYYFNLISSNTFKILEIIILLLNIFISTYILGKKTSKRGYLEGIKFSLIIIILFLLLTLLSSEPLKLKSIIYYLIIMITSVFGSMFGINRRNEKE